MLLLFALVMPLFLLHATPAHAESVVLSAPIPGANLNSPFSGNRCAKENGGICRAHKGDDYRAKTPTPVTYQGSFQSCTPGTSGGTIAVVANACGITQRFLHLSDCRGGKVVTGATGTNNVPHLHYEILINGTQVDPEKAYGQDLCKEDVRKSLLEDAANKGIGGVNASASANSNAPQPAANTDATTNNAGAAYVDTGTANPDTGVVNTGAPYYIVNTADGRTFIQASVSGGPNSYPLLGETSTDVVPTGSTSNDVTGCGTDTWTAMVNQSVLQTRREMMFNERFIAKGDSVLAYSCLRDGLKKVGESLGPVFSETQRWVNAQVDIVGKTVTINKELGQTSLDGAISNAATVPFESWEEGNFKHGILGGTTDSASGGGGDDPSSEDSGAQDTLPCGTMAQVWQAAKCTNVNDNPLFPKFDELIDADKDPRKYPPNMQCRNTGITQGMIDIARGKDVKVTKLETYIDLIYPKGSKCAAPVSTGVTVKRMSGTIIATEKNYQDGVCITIGCSYQNPGLSGTGTCEVKGP